jgi:hypothetical protein
MGLSHWANVGDSCRISERLLFPKAVTQFGDY